MITPAAIESTRLEGAELQELFPNPVLQYLWPDSDALNAELRRLILRKMEGSPGVVKTNRGGWQSQANLQTWPEDCVQVVLARIRAIIKEMVRRTVPYADERHLEDWNIRAWANVNRKGHFNRAHHHTGPNSLWSGVYYVDVGELALGKNVSGRTVFEDRSRIAKEIINNADLYDRELRITPRNGTMVIFPASLVHSVEPYSGEGLRITIAFNLWHKGFAISIYDGMEEEIDWWWINFRGFMILRRKIPEKINGLYLIPRHLVARRLPRTLGLKPWLEHLAIAVDAAFAEASTLADQKRLAAGKIKS
jgi:uncharacterized protein (TIGR02466 family)